jgi:hypothetical protein
MATNHNLGNNLDLMGLIYNVNEVINVGWNRD